MDICLDVERIDHEACVRALLPKLAEHCAAKAQPNELDRFLARLGPNAVPAACSLLRDVSADDRDRMVVWLLASHERRLCASANRHLERLLGADVIRVGRLLAADLPLSRLTLRAADVAVDWAAMLQSKAVSDGVERLGSENGVLKGAARLVLRMGAHLPNEQLERQGIALLKSERVKRRLIAVLQDALRQEGLAVTIADLSVEPNGSPPPLAARAEEDGSLDAWESKLMDALIARIQA